MTKFTKDKPCMTSKLTHHFYGSREVIICMPITYKIPLGLLWLYSAVAFIFSYCLSKP